MPHFWSADRRLAQHDRAARRGYVRSLPDVHGFVQVPAPLLPRARRARAQTLKDALRTESRAAIARHEWACTFDGSDDNPPDLENAPFLPPPVAPASGHPRVRDACAQCDPAPGLHRSCMLVDLSDLTDRLAAFEGEKPDDDALAARCTALLLPRIRPIILEITEFAVDQAISASFGAVE